MRFVVILAVITSFMFVGNAAFSSDQSIDIYTFKKDRVDQEIDGNQGYIMGKPKEIPTKPRKSKRTLIGIDVELPMTASEYGEETVHESTAAPEKMKKETHTQEEWIK